MATVRIEAATIRVCLNCQNEHVVRDLPAPEPDGACECEVAPLVERHRVQAWLRTPLDTPFRQAQRWPIWEVWGEMPDGFAWTDEHGVPLDAA